MGRIRLRSSRLFLRVLPVLVWSGAVLCVVGLFHRRTAQFELVGIADAEVHDVGANTRARLVSVQVQLFKKVNKGDPVAVVNTVLDDERLEAEKAVIKAEINHLDAQLTELRKNYEAEIFNRQSEWWAEMRAFTADVVAARKYIIDANITLEHDLELLEKMNQDITSFTLQHQADLGTDSVIYNQWQTMKANRKKLEEQIERDKGIQAKYKQELIDANDRRDKYVQYHPQAGTDPNEAQRVIHLAKQALERQMDELEQRQREVVLKAPCDGFVSSIDSQVGEVGILPDFPVLSITEEKPSSIIAYVNEDLAGHFTTKKQVEIIKGSEPKQIGRSEITYIGPRVEQLPTRLWQNPTIPQWGRLMQIEIPLGMKLIPGELVGIRVL
jgi:multidrug resistance efflux pump